MAAFATAAAIVGGVIQGANLITSIASANSQARQANKLLKLNIASSYQDLMDSYYTQQENITSLRSGLDAVNISKQQEQSNIGSNYDYLNRWQAYADTEMANMAQEGLTNYKQLAGQWAGQQVTNTETGRTGGSAALIAGESADSLRSYVGDSMKFNTKDGLFGQNFQQQQMDLEADRQTALSQIGIGKQAVDMYEQTAKDVEEAITMQEQSNTQVAGRLNDYYGDEEHWGGKSMDDQKKEVYSDYRSGKGELAGKSEDELREMAQDEKSRDGRLAQYALDQLEEERRRAEEEREHDSDSDGATIYYRDDNDNDSEYVWYDSANEKSRERKVDEKNRTVTETVTAY